MDEPYVVISHTGTSPAKVTMMDKVMQEDWLPRIAKSETKDEQLDALIEQVDYLTEKLAEMGEADTPQSVETLNEKLKVLSHSTDGNLARIREIGRKVDKLLDRVTILEAKMDELSGISERIAKLEETTALNDFI